MCMDPPLPFDSPAFRPKHSPNVSDLRSILNSLQIYASRFSQNIWVQTLRVLSRELSEHLLMLTRKLGQNRPKGAPPGECEAMCAIAGNEVVSRFNGCLNSNRARFLLEGSIRGHYLSYRDVDIWPEESFCHFPIFFESFAFEKCHSALKCHQKKSMQYTEIMTK